MSGRSATGNGRGGARTARGSRAEPGSRREGERYMKSRGRFALELVVFCIEEGGMIAETIPGLERLSPEEKLILVGELWDELTAPPEAFPPRDEHVRLLRERLEHYRKNPNDVTAWAELRARIVGKG